MYRLTNLVLEKAIKVINTQNYVINLSPYNLEISLTPDSLKLMPEAY